MKRFKKMNILVIQPQSIKSLDRPGTELAS